jgi:hypothetical protein
MAVDDHIVGRLLAQRLYAFRHNPMTAHE